MNLKSFFSGAINISAQEVKKFINENKHGDFQLLDVRQPKEYQAGHLAGSQLIPLKKLKDRSGELNKEKPVIVYCAVGGRSRVAAQFLAGMDFSKVFNMTGGIKAWNGYQAIEQEEYGLELLIGDEEFHDAASLAYSMEDRLQKFYQILAKQTVEEKQKNLYVRLSSFEEKHKLRIKQKCQTLFVNNSDPNAILEGGYRIDELIMRTEKYNQTQNNIIEMAMMIETQALDLYSRMARKSKNEHTKKLFLELADEENIHLSYLTEEFERI